MKNICSLFCLLLCCSFFSPEDGITLTVSGLRNNNGHVLVSVFKDGTGYPDEPKKGFRTAIVSIVNNKAVVNFPGLPSGQYAIAILHDENDDKKMNKTWIGLPKEGYGFSNNVMGTFGPPSFSKAAIGHKAGAHSVAAIRTRY